MELLAVIIGRVLADVRPVNDNENAKPAGVAINGSQNPSEGGPPRVTHIATETLPPDSAERWRAMKEVAGSDDGSPRPAFTGEERPPVVEVEEKTVAGTRDATGGKSLWEGGTKRLAD